MRLRLAGVALAIAVLTAIAGCGSNNKTAATLPPIVTTTSSTTTVAVTSTVPQSYVIQKGDTLQKIAAKFGVSVQDLITANNITNPDKIDAGSKLKIPAPGSGATTTAP